MRDGGFGEALAAVSPNALSPYTRWRSQIRKRRLALAHIDEIAKTWGVAPEAVYVIFTEHDGEHFQLSDRVLPSWSKGEDPLADAPRSKRTPWRRSRRSSGTSKGRKP